jgi:hypothetical protein
MSREVRLSDRIKQLSFDPSTNAFSLDSLANGFSPFRDFYEDGDVVFYAATDGVRYEVGSGEYNSDTLTRYPLRSNSLSAGPYYLSDDSASGPSAGKTGFFSPLYLTKSAASGLKGFSAPSSPIVSVEEYTFSGYPGITFYAATDNVNEAVASYNAATVSGEDYSASGQAVDFRGVTEVYVTYPGKYSVFTGAGMSGFQEPKNSGMAFWGNEQTLNYDIDIVWSTGAAAIGISQPEPVFPLDIGGLSSYSQVRASGFIDGGSGIAFSGGQSLEQDVLKTASGGRQLEPFYRNELDDQTKTNQVFSLSGLVDQRLLFTTQYKGMVFAGPESGCVGSCDPDYPEFRYLVAEDIPDLSSYYVVQKNYIDANDVTEGAVAFTTASGTIEYDPEFVFQKGSNYFGVGTKSPQATLDVNGDVRISGDMMVRGSLDIQGDLTYIDSSTVTIQDHQLELGSVSGAAFDDDVYIDDGGIVLKSSDGDKKWTWINSTDAWTTSQKVDVSGIIFAGDNTNTISGAYQGGSGLIITNVANGHLIDVGNMFQVSGEDGGNGYIHQADVLVVSGVSGIDTTYSSTSEGGRVVIDPTFLYNDVYDKVNSSGNSVYDKVNSSGNSVLDQAKLYSDVSGVSLSGYADGIANMASSSTVSIVSGYFQDYFVNVSGNRAVDVASGITMDASGALNLAIGALGGGYGQWQLHDGANDVLADVLSDNVLSVSGVSGINVSYTAATLGAPHELRIDAVPLSGYLDTVSGMALDTDLIYYTQAQDLVNDSGNRAADYGSGIAMQASGALNMRINALGGGYGQWQFHDGDNEVLDDILSDNVLTVSGVTGVAIDYNNTTKLLKLSAGPASGYFENYYRGWQINAKGGVSNTSTFTEFINPREVLQVSGVSGILVDYSVASNTLNLSAEGISGWANTNTSVTSGNAVYAAKLYSDVSGVSISGYVDGVANIAAGSAFSFGSGITSQDGVIDFKHDGSGTLQHLIFNEDIRIGKGALAEQGSTTEDSVAIGYLAGSGSSVRRGVFIGANVAADCDPMYGGVFIGEGAALNASGYMFDSVFIGNNAGKSAYYLTGDVIIGKSAGEGKRSTESWIGGFVQSHSIAIGTSALNLAVSGSRDIAIGYLAASGANRHHESISIGPWAAQRTYNSNGCINLGKYAGNESKENLNSIGIGQNALDSSSGVSRITSIGHASATGIENSRSSVIMGDYSAALSAEVNYSEVIGVNAGYKSQYNEYSSIIGYRAGYLSSGIRNSAIIGPHAGETTTFFFTSSAISESVGIGPYALSNSSGVYRTVAIGHYAGSFNNWQTRDPATSDVSEYNIFIGASASSDIIDGGAFGSHCLKITPKSTVNSDAWLPQKAHTNYAVSIGDFLFGISASVQNAGSSLAKKHIMIGNQPATISEVEEATLSVKPHKTTDTVLKLYRNPNHSASVLTTTDTLNGWYDNEILDRHGQLVIPTARTRNGNTIYDANNQIIQATAGKIAFWRPSSGSTYLLVYDGYSNIWKRTANALVNF